MGSYLAATQQVSFNPIKTETMTISRKLSKDQHSALFMDNLQISLVETHKHFGKVFFDWLYWQECIKHTTDKAWNRNSVMRKLQNKLDLKPLEIIYPTFKRSLLEYGDVIWGNCTECKKIEVDKIRNEAARNSCIEPKEFQRRRQ